MFCSNCGKEIADGSAFCKFCGFKMQENAGDAIDNNVGNGSAGDVTKSNADKNRSGKVVEYKPKKKKRKIILPIVIVFIFFAAIVSISGNSSKQPGALIDEKIAIVKDGYFGEFTECSIGELLEATYNYGDNEWSYGTDNDGKPMVQYTTKDKESNLGPVAVQFKLKEEEKVFEVCGFDEGTGKNYEPTEVASILDNIYFLHIMAVANGDKSTLENDDVMVAKLKEMQKISGTSVLYGAAKDFTGDRAKISKEYFDSDSIELNVVELIDLYNDNMYKEVLDRYSTDSVGYSDTDDTVSFDDSADNNSNDNSKVESPAIGEEGYASYSTDDIILYLMADGSDYYFILYYDSDGKARLRRQDPEGYGEDLVIYDSFEISETSYSFTSDGVSDEFIIVCPAEEVGLSLQNGFEYVFDVLLATQGSTHFNTFYSIIY